MKRCCNQNHAWGVENIKQLLSPAPLKVEMGVIDGPEPLITVAVRTDLHGCSGKMLDWWFKFFETTEHIKWWHPLDHVAHYGWDENWHKGKSYIGATVSAKEKLADLPAVAAKLKFHAAEDFFAPADLEEAYSNNWLSAAICSSIGFGDDIILDEDGDPMDGEMMHLARDTDFGCVLRSRFLLGKQHPVPLEISLNLMRHCYNEFTYLSNFLPSLYHADNPGVEIPRPW
ncbi:hypothetical protein [Desulfovibrio sp. UCD-KL4C]|uniref:DAPG hydrolase family protein n=1 Tax=Desulfovibrio sp. UCD-KL4C TaxID=2578120 RepID=UPI0025BF76E8|nr:hypothetical protein [Desulfovibrio sp. UCD-KL4C]